MKLNPKLILAGLALYVLVNLYMSSLMLREFIGKMETRPLEFYSSVASILISSGVAIGYIFLVRYHDRLM